LSCECSNIDHMFDQAGAFREQPTYRDVLDRTPRVISKYDEEACEGPLVARCGLAGIDSTLQ